MAFPLFLVVIAPPVDGVSHLGRAHVRWPGPGKSTAVAALLLCAFGQALAQAAPAAQPLTLDAALRAAQTRSAMLQGQDAAIQSLREMAVPAGRLADPVLRLSVDNLPIEGPMRYSLTDDFMTMRTVSLMQTYTGADKRQARSAIFAREADAAAAMRTMQVARLKTQTARAWFDRYYLQQMLALLQEQRDDAVLVADAVQAAYRGGRAPQADVFAGRSAVARIDDRLLELRADLHNAQTALARWVGDVATQSLGAPPPIDQTPLAAHDLSHQLDRHPDIALMGAKEQVAIAQADVARNEKEADWSWSLMYSKRGSQFGDMVSIGASIPMQWDQKNRQDRVLAAQLEKVEQVRAEREELRREHLFEVQRMLVNWRSNLTRLGDYDTSLIPLASERALAQEAAFRGGTAPLSAVLEARRVQTDTRLERLRIEQQTASLWAELEFLIPQSTPVDGAPAASNPVSPLEPKQ